jgi:RNA polymerase sigma-70 factor (ECF subfamily)
LLGNEGELIEACQKGNGYAFNRLVEIYQSQVYNLAYRIMGNGEAAADATQEAFLSAYRNIKQYRGGSFRAWLLRITTSRCYDEFRRQGRSPSTTSLDQEPEDGPAPEPRDNDPTPEEVAIRADLQQHIQRCLMSLPYDQRLVVVLSDVQGMSYEEVAEGTGMALGTVKSRLSRGRAALRDLLTTAGELPPGVRRHD